MDSTPSRLRIVLVAGIVGLSCLLFGPAGAAPRAPAASRAPAAPPTLAEVQSLIRAGKFAEAERQARALLREAEQTSAPESLEVAEVLDQLSEAMRRSGKGGRPETREICERALRIKEKSLGRDDPGYAASLYQLGFLLYVNGDYNRAKPYLERALAIREAKLGPGHPDVATTLAPLGALISDMGDQALAQSMFERALRIREATVGPDSPETAECLEAIATIRFRAGDFAGSVPLHEKALHIWERALGRDHPKVATCLNNLAVALSETGDNDGALACNDRALEIRIKTLGRDHEFVATSLVNSGNYLAAKGDLTQARKRFEQALAIEEARFGAESHEAGMTLTRIGLLCLQQGRFHEAGPYLERAVGNIERGLGPDHPDLADALAALAITSASEGDTASAWRGFERAIAIRMRALGPTHPDVGLVLTQYARALEACGQYGAALDFALQGEEISREHLRLTSRGLSERQALNYAAARPAGARIAVWALLDIPGASPDTIGRVWDAVVKARTLVLDEMAFRHHAVAAEGDSAAVRLAAELAAGRRRLANLLVAGPGGDPPEGYRATVERTRLETERTERALAARSAAFRREQERSRIGLRDVASSLPRGCALVAYTTAGDSSRLAYLAFVIPDSGAAPAIFRLGPVAKIDTAILQWLADVNRSGSDEGGSRAGERASRASGAVVKRAVWAPLASTLGGVKRVFLVPEGTINLVNFAALPADEGKYLLEAGADFHYLSAERDLVPGPPGSHGVGLLALGDPSFGSDSIARTRSKPDCAEFAALRFRALPQSGREAREIAAIWDRPGWDRPGMTMVLTGAQASEAAFKSKAPHRRALHLATHGFFISEECQEESRGTSRGIGGIAPSDGSTAKRKPRALPVGSAPEANPLLLSGLALAGANHRGAAKSEEEDGVLTAEEIATLDLTGVEWAVLSACDTGKGRIRAGEGVLGLRRAFQIAGAATVIMSLWEVEDESARDWMRAFYEGRVTEKLDTADAVTQASLRVLRGRRAQARSTDPFYWAAFVAAGDWR